MLWVHEYPSRAAFFFSLLVRLSAFLSTCHVNLKSRGRVGLADCRREIARRGEKSKSRAWPTCLRKVATQAGWRSRVGNRLTYTQTRRHKDSQGERESRPQAGKSRDVGRRIADRSKKGSQAHLRSTLSIQWVASQRRSVIQRLNRPTKNRYFLAQFPVTTSCRDGSSFQKLPSLLLSFFSSLFFFSLSHSHAFFLYPQSLLLLPFYFFHLSLFFSPPSLPFPLFPHPYFATLSLAPLDFLQQEHKSISRPWFTSKNTRSTRSVARLPASPMTSLRRSWWLIEARLPSASSVPPTSSP